ncbi:hypothetical protein DM2_1117 [Halorubrum sp. DM2]|nr:hypothetical protein DM2_1117 [Halorubrum sp. DM2]
MPRSAGGRLKTAGRLVTTPPRSRRRSPRRRAVSISRARSTARA